MRHGLLVGLAAFAIGSTTLRAESAWQRWTGQEDADATLSHIFAKLSQRNGYRLEESDFRIGEDRELATSRYLRLDQVEQGIDVRRMAVRLWTDKRSGRLIQLEAQTVAPGRVPLGVMELESSSLDHAEAAAKTWARTLVRSSDDAKVRDVAVDRAWDQGRLIHVVTVKARRGTHTIVVDALTNEVASHAYAPFANADELSVPAYVYPVWEEFEGEIQPRRLARLKYILRRAPRPTLDPVAPLRTRTYFFNWHDLVLGATPEGRAQGYWSTPWLRGEIKSIFDGLPRLPNVFARRGGSAGEGVLLHGRYATINIHPDAFDRFSGITLPKAPSGTTLLRWREDVALDDWELIPESAARGQTLRDRNAALGRDATRHPTHDPATYINSGFDEVQVYYAINELFDALRGMGFTDPDLAERPFHAFLFDPDVEMQDNAYYTDDTINFTTYSPRSLNYARDNTTIWHELGHGVMDRLMGDRLRLDDTGGLSEGMADFVAELVIQAATRGAPFPGQQTQRIINNTGFFLTNEVHDDGEAYGGVMKSFLDLALSAHGRKGLAKVADLVLEAMRLSRDHPGLTTDDWFERMRFADARGHGRVRRPGELHTLLEQALASRNFASEAERGRFVFRYNGQEIDADAAGSRGNEIPLELAAEATSTHELEIQALDGARFHYVWPVEVKVFFNSGPLQGAIDWDGEDHEPLVRTLNGPGDVLRLPLTVKGTCDQINRTDGTCSDFAYVQLWNHGASAPVAKKRFYLRIRTL